MKKCILFLFLIIHVWVSAASLPHYKLTIAQTDLDAMYASPKDEQYYPAVFEVDTFKYNVLARFKGSTTLGYPKKSWAIKFSSKKNYFGVSRINLHADYKDDSKMRNFLIMNLFDFMGYPASQIKHVSYEVNGEPYGVYTQVEQINDEYLSRNGRTVVSLYKANNHAALMAPTTHDEYYGRIWDIEEGGDPSYNELRVFFNKCLYWSSDDFNATIENWVDIDNFINYFAIHFVFVDMDNFTKNTYLNKNNTSNKFEFFPWDNEGSFGNSAFGEFDSTLVNYNLKDAYTPEYHVVFQRILENPALKLKFNTALTKIITEGFSFLDSLMDTTYLQIRDEVYIDPKKETTNAQFDQSLSKIKWFMNNRKQFLEHNELPVRNVLSDLFVSNPMPTPTDSTIVFRIKSPVAQPVNMFFADSVDFNVFGQPFKFSRMQLYDDGLHNDLLANDLIYGNSLNANSFGSNLVPITITGAEQNYPPNGFFYIDYYGSKCYAINKGNSVSDIGNYLSISKMYEYDNNYFVEITNTSTDKSIDLSYCHLRTNDATKDFMFTENVVIEPNEKIYVSSNYNLGSLFFEGKRTFYNLYYQLAVGDSLHLLSPFLTSITSTKIAGIQELTVQSPALVINEINYKSGTLKPTGDWVEIVNPTDKAVDLSYWVFKDGDNGHNFTLPYGYILPAGGYVVIAENITQFQTAASAVVNVVGSTEFGLSGSGEAVRLYDNYGQLVDSVLYSSGLPWPIEASGTGATLELSDPKLDNSLGTNWYADISKAGSPGIANYIETSVLTINNNLFKLYPNPTTGVLYINSKESVFSLQLLNLQGSVILDEVKVRLNQSTLNLNGIPKGVYILRFNTNGVINNQKLVIK